MADTEQTQGPREPAVRIPHAPARQNEEPGASAGVADRVPGDGMFRALVEAAPDAIVGVDAAGKIALVNEQTERLFGYAREELIGESLECLVPERYRDVHRRHRDGYVGHPHTRPMGAEMDLCARRKDGSEFPVEISLSPLQTESGLLVTSIIRDVSERRRLEHKLRHLAEHDALTGLFNRRRFEEELSRQVAYSGRYRQRGAVLVLDLDNFKYVNDALGHRAGDELIRGVAAVLLGRLRETDVIARLGGDEFAVLLPAASSEQARGVAVDLVEAIRAHRPVLAGKPRHVTASCGVVPFGGESEADYTAEELLAAADAAMYEAKDAGRDRVAFHTARTRDARTLSGLTMTEGIRHALEEDGFVLHWQPILDLRTKETVQGELLVRMLADGRLVLPGAFLPTAERFGLIREVDRWVVGHAIELIAHSSAHLRLEVNLSAATVSDPEMPAIIEREMRDAAIDPACLIFEITETAAIASMEQAASFATQLRRCGCGFALDDFGTGFDSFSYLKRLPSDYLKIDGDFIAGLTRSNTDRLVVQAIVQISKGLGKKTIAEFVGDDETVALLQELGVDYAQGFHIGRPRSVAELVVAPVP